MRRPVGVRDLMEYQKAGGYIFFNDTATTEIYTLSLHDALPIWQRRDLDRVEAIRRIIVGITETEISGLDEIGRALIRPPRALVSRRRVTDRAHDDRERVGRLVERDGAVSRAAAGLDLESEGRIR